MQNSIQDAVNVSEMRVRVVWLFSTCHATFAKSITKNSSNFALVDKRSNPATSESQLESVVESRCYRFLSHVLLYIDKLQPKNKKSEKQTSKNGGKSASGRIRKHQEHLFKGREGEGDFSLAKRHPDVVATQKDRELPIAKQKHEKERKRLEDEKNLKMEVLCEETKKILSEAKLNKVEQLTDVYQDSQYLSNQISHIIFNNKKLLDWSNA